MKGETKSGQARQRDSRESLHFGNETGGKRPKRGRKASKYVKLHPNDEILLGN
jgi:hypothetical protein